MSLLSTLARWPDAWSRSGFPGPPAGHTTGAGGDEYRQLDYPLIAPALAAGNHNVPEIMRNGLPWRTERYDGERFEEVGENHPRASGHRPLYGGLELT